MKARNLILVSLLSLGLTSSSNQNAKAATKDINSSINNVTIFLSGAQITRSGKVQLDKGITQVKFTNLTQYIDPQSVQATGKGRATILSVTHQLNYLSGKPATESTRILKDSLELLQSNIDINNSIIEVYNEEKSLIKSNKTLTGQNGTLKAEELQKMAELYRTRLLEINDKLLALKKKNKTFNEHKTRIQQQLNQENQNKHKTTSEIIVEVMASQATHTEFEISYNTSQAGWTPSYNLRSKDIGEPIALAFKGKVWQNTGSDWNNVNIALSTSNPRRSQSKPTLYTWWLNITKQYELRSKSDRKEKDRALINSLQPAAGMIDLRGTVEDAVAMEELSEYVNASQHMTNTKYSISIPYNIPSDHKHHQVMIDQYELDAEYKYYSVPKLDTDAFLLASVSGWEQYNLLAGEVNIFSAGTYIGKSFLNTQLSVDTLDFSLGRDPNVVVQRTRVKDYTTTSLLGSNKKEQFIYEYKVRNKKDKAIEIEVLDHIPLSQNEDISVKIEEHEGKLDKDTGIITWSLKVKPQETKDFKLDFSVKYPKDISLPL